MNLTGPLSDSHGVVDGVGGGQVDRVQRDALLVVRAQLGDRGALAELVGYWHEPVWRYVWRMIDAPGAGDDVSQDAWAAALRALPGLVEPRRFAPWLFTIVRRSVVDHLRVRYRTAVAADEKPVVDDVSEAVLDRAQAAEGMAGLPPREREVLALFYLLDFPLDECAQVLEIPEGTVKSRLFRARRLLRDQLIGKGYGHG